MDTIFIDQLTADTVIGVYERERRVRQRVVLDLALDCDIRAAAAADDVARTLDYDTVAKRAVAFVENSRFELVETLCERLARLILAEFDIARVRLAVTKPGALPGAAGVGVRVTRPRRALGAPRGGDRGDPPLPEGGPDL